MNKDEVASRGPPRTWVRAEDYVEALARRRTARRARTPNKPRTQPESPRLLLSTLPFAALMGGFAVLTLAIMIMAWPHSSERPADKANAPEVGTASKGWFQDAQKDFKKAG